MKTAVIFPGQGSQFVGMGKDLFDYSEPAHRLFDLAGEKLGYDLAEICFNGPEEELSQTRVTQPAIYVHSVAVFRLLEEKGFRADFAAGHSLGEYSALAAAGFLSFEEGLELVGLRGRLMQEAGYKAPGAMAAVVGLDDRRVEELCREIGDSVVPANFNAPGQVVVSGSLKGVDKLIETAQKAGARLVKKLKVSGAFHSPLMSYAAAAMRERLKQANIVSGRIPVVANVSAGFETEPERIKDLLVEQITSPVRWTASVETLAAGGALKLVEAGPGNVLAGLCRRINRNLEITSIGKIEEIKAFSA